MSLYGDFFKCYICTKHYNVKISKDAHADNYCKQSMVYKESLGRLKEALVCRGVLRVFVSTFHVEPVIHLPWAALTINLTIPMDPSDSTFDLNNEEAKETMMKRMEKPAKKEK